MLLADFDDAAGFIHGTDFVWLHEEAHDVLGLT
jgi:hypothetical protein